MLESILHQSRLAYDAYWSDIREDWVLKWPGQVVQTISCHTWTKEVSLLFIFLMHVQLFNLLVK